MSARRLKIEVRDDEGNAITVAFQGQLTRQKALQLLDFVELLGGVSSRREDVDALSDLSKYAKLRLVITERFPIGWFTSTEALIAYEEAVNEPMNLSTASTYLARLTQANFLSRAGTQGRRRYKIRRHPPTQERRRLQRWALTSNQSLSGEKDG